MLQKLPVIHFFQNDKSDTAILKAIKLQNPSEDYREGWTVMLNEGARMVLRREDVIVRFDYEAPKGKRAASVVVTAELAQDAEAQDIESYHRIKLPEGSAEVLYDAPAANFGRAVGKAIDRFHEKAKVYRTEVEQAREYERKCAANDARLRELFPDAQEWGGCYRITSTAGNLTIRPWSDRFHVEGNISDDVLQAIAEAIKLP